jgi:protein-L-isoaspartate(D-aspartate) O-methyltransferase
VKVADFEALRERMVERHIVGRGITDARILAAFRKVPREDFVPEAGRAHAYEDTALPIEAEQTISQPFIVAAMIEAAELDAMDLVLEVGAGSGYATALIAELVDEVVAIERHGDLARRAGARLERLGYDHVSIYQGDGTRGFPEKGPFDAIIVSACGSHVPIPCSSSSKWAVGWSCRWGRRTGRRNWSRSSAPGRTNTSRRRSPTCASCP